MAASAFLDPDAQIDVWPAPVWVRAAFFCWGRPGMTAPDSRVTFGVIMADERECKPVLTPAGEQAAEDRRRRLAAALRENLRKRKNQQRARSAEAGLSSGPKTRDAGSGSQD